MEAHVLSLNEFNMPKVFSESDSAYVHIIQLILLEPGTFQSHPNMGIGIKSRYRFNNEDNFLSNLATDIRNQITTYLPWLVDVDVSVTQKDQTLGFVIDTSTGTYAIAYDSSNNTMEAAASYVLEEL